MVEDSTASQRLNRGQQVYAIKTWRYLRLAMVALVIGLAISIAYEYFSTHPNCFRESISAYYYTPVHNFFVAVLMSVGVCLFCLKGSTELEDTLLNLAGMLAPVVALVPNTPDDKCYSEVVAVKNLAAIENNVTALIAVGGFGLVVLAVLAIWSGPSRTEAIGYGVAALVVGIAAGVFWGGDRDVFVEHAHYWAAIPMFVFIIAVVCINAVAYRPKPARSPRNPYSAIGVAMVACVPLAVLAKRLGWDHTVLALEGALIVLFAAFWFIQTVELWHEGLRETAGTQ